MAIQLLFTKLSCPALYPRGSLPQPKGKGSVPFSPSFSLFPWLPGRIGMRQRQPVIELVTVQLLHLRYEVTDLSLVVIGP